MNTLTPYTDVIQKTFLKGKLPPIEDFKKLLGETEPDHETRTLELAVPKLLKLSFTKKINFAYIKKHLNFPITDYCLVRLSDMYLLHEGSSYSVKAGFYEMKEEFSVIKCTEELMLLSQKFNRRFRHGTPLELIFYLVKKMDRPEHFVCLGNIVEDHIFLWTTYAFGESLHAFPHKLFLGPTRKVFIVEDL